VRILLLVGRYLPSITSSAKLAHDLATAIRDQGHEIIVASPDPDITTRISVREEEGIQVLRVRTGQLKSASLVVRGINESLLSSVMWRAGKRFFLEHPCDLIIFYSPTIFWSGLVRALVRRWHCPTYMILRDIFPRWAVDAGIMRRHSAPYNFFRYKELQQYKVADVIGVQSPANLRYFQHQWWSPRGRLEVLYNWMRVAPMALPDSGHRERLGLAGKTVFFYGGNIGVAQDMDNILRLAGSLLDDESIHFLLVGDGSESQRLQAAVRDQRLVNVTIHPGVSQEKYHEMLSEFDVGLITLDRKLKTQNFPGKLLSYLYFGLPVLASINSGNDLREAIEENNAGMVCINGDDPGFRELTLELAHDAALRKTLGQAGKILLRQKFSAEVAAEQILATI